MRILLVGEYSRLHNSLKEGLSELGHKVVIVGNGDGFKDFPVDYSIEARWSKSAPINFLRQIIARLFNFDLGRIEQGLRFWKFLPLFRGFDVVQLINESPIQTNKTFELFLLRKLFKQNKNIFLLSCGCDYLSVEYLFSGKLYKSIIQPLQQHPELRKEYGYVLEYRTQNHRKLHEFVYENCRGIIASDIDYQMPLNGNKKFLSLIPNPINYTKLPFKALNPNDTIVIFLGINRWNYHQKGISYFERALKVINEKYHEKTEVIISENVPYAAYIESYDKAHIVLDQVYAYDQGYNALEAMAKGKVVFTGAEKEFESYYNLSEKVAINTVPDVDSIVRDLSYLIENPNEIIAIGERARKFIEVEHDYRIIANRYMEIWSAH
ncbi:MAG TPA: glycosyltransferase [Flavobacterium sp.]|jgi:glycosyltransferase involved in cell wall biosynthesis